MTQRQRVLKMLQDAGPKGVSSKTFIESYLPRAAARIQELKDEGVPITTEREGKYVRYFVGVGGSTVARCHVDARVYPSDSGEARIGDQDQAVGPASAPASRQPVEAVSGAPARSVPSMFDADIDWAA